MGYGSAHGTADAALYGPVDRAPFGETANMDPYTTQISNRLGEADKYLTEITIQLSRIADKLVGVIPQTLSASLGNEKNPTPVAMMEQIVGQANILNRKIHNLGDIVNRLQAL